MEINNISKEYVVYINDIVDSLRTGNLALFCGSGATADATNITWSELLKREFKVLDKEEHDYYRLAQYYELHFNRGKLINQITNSFSEKKVSKHIETLLLLPICEYWTTNFDTIIERMIEEETGLEPSVIYNSENIIKLNEHKKYKVFKMNGTITDSNSMIVTKEDYFHYKQNQGLLIEFLKRELILKSFIFIGYSFADNLILDCLHDLISCFPNLVNHHYRIVKKEDNNPVYQQVESQYLQDSYNIRTIYVNSFNEIDDLIELIYKEYKKYNVFISGSFRNLSANEENYANNLCKSIVEMLLKNDFNIYSGDGKRLGSYVISNATKNLMSKNMNYYHNKLTIMPYIDHTFKHKNPYEPQRTNLIQKMIKDCSIAIFLYGQAENGEYSQGVFAEYLEAKKKSLFLIPIPTTGFAAKEIFNAMTEDSVPWYLEKYITILNSEKNTQKIANTILEIINLINNT